MTDAATNAAAAGGDRTKVRVIFNTSAGSKLPTPSPTRADLEAALRDAGVAAEIRESGSPDEAKAFVRDAIRDGCGLVVAAGGDGTIGLIATELLGTGTALGILPLGSVMNIPRMLGLPRDIPGAARILAEGVDHDVDVGEVGGEPFFEAGSVGMNAAIFREASRHEEGVHHWPLRTIWVALRYQPARMQITLEDRLIRTRALTVVVSNGPYTGAGMTVAPDARLDDGRFDVNLFERFSKFELVRHFASIAFGRRAYAPRVRTFRSRLVRISSVHPLPARADSKDLGTTPVEFRVRPGALRVRVPPAGLPEGAPDPGDGGS